MSAEELEKLLLQKEGESVKDNAVQSRSPGGVSGKRVIGKAVAKGGMLLKGKNPGNVSQSHTIRKVWCLKAQPTDATARRRHSGTDVCSI